MFSLAVFLIFFAFLDISASSFLDDVSRSTRDSCAAWVGQRMGLAFQFVPNEQPPFLAANAMRCCSISMRVSAGIVPPELEPASRKVSRTVLGSRYWGASVSTPFGADKISKAICYLQSRLWMVSFIWLRSIARWSAYISRQRCLKSDMSIFVKSPLVLVLVGGTGVLQIMRKRFSSMVSSRMVPSSGSMSLSAAP